MDSCGFRTLLEKHFPENGITVCGQTTEYPGHVDLISLESCTRDVQGHLRSLQLVADEGVDSELKLLLVRAGVFCVEEQHKTLTICPRHRAEYGIRWRSKKTNCSAPQAIATHSANAKGSRRINSKQAWFILKATGTLIHVGLTMCTKCRDYVNNKLDEEGKTSTACTRDVGSSASNEESEDSDSADGLSKRFTQLRISSSQQHDDTFLSPESGSTTSSDDATALSQEEPRDKLNRFLVSRGVAPITQPWLDLETASATTKWRYAARAVEAVAAVLTTISPNNAGALWQAIESSTAIYKALGIDEISQSSKEYLQALAEAYNQAESWECRRQVLSIMAGIANYKTITYFIPTLSRYRFTVANLHHLQFGRGAPIQHQPTVRLRVTRGQLDHFLSFITSPHLIQDLPFGQKLLTLSTGTKIEVPNVIRTVVPQRIVEQYKVYCDETSFKPFSDRTMLRILSECKASVRKSLQGLDYFAADGARAFDDLIRLVREVSELSQLGMDWERQHIDALKTAKLYLKSDYKVHLNNSAEVADHCIVYALSDKKESTLRKKCDHDHKEVCHQCESLKNVLRDISNAISEASYPNEDAKDEAIYLTNTATLAIQSWKCHLLRSVRQDQARLDTIDTLDKNSVFIVNDWAMKFLPQRYRESQTDWFGKRGISWHISVVYRRFDGVLQWQAFVHVVQSCSQGSSPVVAIIQHVLSTLKKEHPEVGVAYLRQDNAACYHSSPTILACQKITASTGVTIKRVDFSDPQGGKGAADRLAATCKGHIRAFINEGNDVLSSTDLKDALLSNGGINGVRVVALEAIPELKEVDQSIPGVTKFNNFEFSKSHIRCWRAYKIGVGKKIKVESSSGFQIAWLDSPFSPGNFRALGGKTKAQPKKSVSQGSEEVDAPGESPSSGVFCCPQEGCIRVFQRVSALEKHLSLEKCVRHVEKHTLLDLAKIGYSSHLEEGVGVVPTINIPREQGTSHDIVSEGWALRPTRKSYCFNEKQISYMKAKFRIGQTTGRKQNADVVARDMRRARDADGNRMFKLSEFLTEQQISSYFSRLSAAARQQDPDEADIQSAREEINFSSVRASTEAIDQPRHPLVYDQYDLCSMDKQDTMKDLKVAMLQHICEQLDLDVPQRPVRRKAPYLSLLKDFVSKCPCKNA